MRGVRSKCGCGPDCRPDSGGGCSRFAGTSTICSDTGTSAAGASNAKPS
jgi:hypothetical protein